MNGDWFAGRLKELREGAGLTQQDLAEKAGLSKDGVSHLEQGRRKPAWETAIALASALGVDCRAFNEPPSEAAEKRGRGSPPKTADAEATPAPKKRAGRRTKKE